MNFKRAYSWLVVILVLGGSLLWQGLGSSRGTLIETDIMALLPRDRQNPVAQAAMDRVLGGLERKVLFVIEAEDKDQAVRAAEDLVGGLKQMELFSSVSGRIDSNQQKSWSDLYYPKRFQLLTPEQRERLRHTPEAQVERVQMQLYSPFSGVTGRELQNNPFLLFREFLSGLTSQSGAFTLIDGFPGKSDEEKSYLLITAEAADSAYGARGANQLPALLELEQQIRERYAVELYHTGVLCYAAEGIKSAQREISTIGIGSLIGVLVLLIIVYRSLLPIGLSLLSIGCGLLAAFVVTVWIFGRVHLFSLVFGASLIGISIDYAFHYLTHRLAAGSSWHSGTGLKAIFSAITMGLITSVMGYAGLLAAPFPGLQQLAVFSTVGLAGAYATVVCWYPVLAAKPGTNSGLPWAAPMNGWIVFWSNRSVRIALPLLVLGLAIPGLFRAEFNDDIRQLQALSPDLKAQEKVVQQVMGIQNGQHMLLVTGDDEQAVLERLHETGLRLNELIQNEILGGFHSLEPYAPSERIQRDNFELVQSLYLKQGHQLKQTLGLSETPSMATDFSPLTLASFLASPAAEPLRFLWLGKLDDTEKVGSVILLNGVKNAAPLNALAAQNPDLHFLDKASEISALFSVYRVRITYLLLLATLSIWILLALRYGVAKGTRMVLPPILAGLFSISIAGLSGAPMNLFNLLALAIVLGIGIDYTLFFGELRERSGQALLSTQLSISLSAATTLLSFGLLALSETAAIHCFGMTVLVGIFISWLLAPLAMTLEKRS